MTISGNHPTMLQTNLQFNKENLERAFLNCQDVVFELRKYGSELTYSVLVGYCNSLITEDSDSYLIRMLSDLANVQSADLATIDPDAIAYFFDHFGATSLGLSIVSDVETAVDLVLQGYIVMLFDGWNCAVAYKSATFDKRQVDEPVSEPVVQGPREGTVESLGINLGMIRQRIQSPQLKIEFITAGEKSKTTIAFCYLEGVILPEILEEFRNRMDGIEQYDVPETSYIQDWVQDSSYTPFPQYRNTERTDVAAAALMDGKMAILVDNSPMVMIAPAFLVDFISTGEDYYVRTIFASMIRLVRLLAFFIALTLPSIYIALSTFHPELIPSVLLLAILDTREGIPFPAFLEALIMEVSFELLREAGIRLPRPVGSAVSIVGALVIGQAAITAKIASPIMVIVVALTGIASFAIPHYDIAIAIRILRFPFMVAASLLGGFGLMIMFLLTLLHLACLHTLGQPYLSSLAPFKARDLRDIVVRAPLRKFLESPRNRRLLDSTAPRRKK
ncbi:spore germination protein [Paenibacillus qinlingensis]|uniref:spore germination protein n=1 Tax=Paenibacillus qinlingensis TaxID=1837343 RepID=UPI00156619EE|nr:spore germination protein [Paenibacillus qinlingensis]NQX59663.1 spore germination protein [Paenibacillus qinlingensis]